jgi:hypothetical protein
MCPFSAANIKAVSPLLVFRIHICPFFKEKLDNFGVAFFSSQHQNRPTTISFHIHICPFFKEELDNFGVALFSSTTSKLS